MARRFASRRMRRATLDGWDDFVHLMMVGGIAFAVLSNAAVFWLVTARDGTLAGHRRRAHSHRNRGDLRHRLPGLKGHEANMIGSTFNRTAVSLEEKQLSDRKAIEAGTALQQPSRAGSTHRATPRRGTPRDRCASCTTSSRNR